MKSLRGTGFSLSLSAATFTLLALVIPIGAQGPTNDKGSPKGPDPTVDLNVGRLAGAPNRRGKNRPPARPTPHYADGRVNLGPFPGEKGMWEGNAGATLATNVRGLDNPAMNLPTNLKIADVPFLPWARAVYNYRQASTTKDDPPELSKVLSGKAISNLQKLVRTVPVGDYVVDYVARLVRATRPRDPSSPDFVKKMVDFGAGPRAGQFLIRGGQAMAALDGRFSVAIDDIRKVAVPVLRHRVSTNFQAQAEGKTSDDLVNQLLQTVTESEPAKYVAAPHKKS